LGLPPVVEEPPAVDKNQPNDEEEEEEPLEVPPQPELPDSAPEEVPADSDSGSAQVSAGGEKTGSTFFAIDGSLIESLSEFVVDEIVAIGDD
jgi:hypothetical protein